MRRHDAIRDLLFSWLKERTQHPVHKEQVLPELQTDGTEEKRMDIVAADDVGARILVDVMVTHAVSGDVERLARAALGDGAAADAAESKKRSTYRNARGLVPFIFETGGRVGVSGLAMVRRLAPTDPVQRSACIGGLWQTLQVALQRHNALILLAA